MKCKYIDKILTNYNFGKDFKTWFKILYNDSQSGVINGGIFLLSINKNAAAVKETLYSPYLLILAFEPLARAIELSPKVKGIKIKNKEYKIGQYADDIHC